jgi:creatinine amidohydrolase
LLALSAAPVRRRRWGFPFSDADDLELIMLDAAAASSPEFAAAIKRGAVAILAVGALEQHGAHLPLSTDTILSHGVAKQLCVGLDGLLMPAIAYGDAWSTEGYAGTISLSPDTLRAVLIDLGRGLKRSGAKALIIVNGHFGNREPIALAARALREEIAFPVLHLDYPGMDRLAERICESKPAAPTFYHADEVETSMMLALAPDLVRMEKAESEYPAFPDLLGMTPLQLDSFNKSGVFGDPRAATAEKGRALIDGIVDESMRLAKLFLTTLS